MSRLWLIGEAPTQANGPPFTGRAGQKLTEYLGRDLRQTFVLANVLTAWPGKTAGGKGTKFPRQEAREGVERLFTELDVHDWVIVVGGRNASNAWRLNGLKGPYNWAPFGQASSRTIPKRLRRMLICWIPHPSPINQKWNDPKNILKLKEFIDDAIRLREELGYGSDGAGPEEHREARTDQVQASA